MVSTLTLAYRGVYIAHLPGKAAGDCRTKRVTTGTAEIETYKNLLFPIYTARTPRFSVHLRQHHHR